MRRWFRIASITILPVVVVAFIFLTERRTSPGEDSVFEVVGLGLLNALTFALPQFACVSARGLFHFTSRVCDAGLVAADLMLLVFAVVVVFQTDPFAGSWLWLILAACHCRKRSYGDCCASVGSERSNRSMKPTSPFRNTFSVFATTPCRGLSL